MDPQFLCHIDARLGWDKSSRSHVSGSLGVKIWHYFFLYWNNCHEIFLFRPDIIIILTFKIRIRSSIPFKIAFEMPVTREKADSKQSSANCLLRLLWDKQPGHHPELGLSPGHRNLWLPLLYKRSDCGHRALFCCKSLLIEIFFKLNQKCHS